MLFFYLSLPLVLLLEESFSVYRKHYRQTIVCFTIKDDKWKARKPPLHLLLKCGVLCKSWKSVCYY